MRPWPLITLAPLALSGCLGMLDVLGFQSQFVSDSDQQRDERLEDDDIADKHPEENPDLLVVETFEGCEMTLNKSGSVTKLDILPFSPSEVFLDGALFPSRSSAMRLVEAVPGADQIPSIEVVNGALKPFNDGLYAAVEIGLQEGMDGLLQSKRQLLYDLLADTQVLTEEASGPAQTALEDAQAHIAAGLLAGGNEVDVDADIEAAALLRLELFDAQPMFSEPIGFYTWDPVLGEVFRQDRFLQNLGDDGEPFDTFAALAVVLGSDPELLERYQQVHVLYAGLTNPYASYSPLEILPYVDGLGSLDDLAAVQADFLDEHGEPFPCTMAWYALFPSSASKDTRFFNENYCETGLPAGVDFMDELIDAIESGDLDLAPDEESGWYDYQLYALETLLLPERGPESDHLLLTAAYKQKLVETFKSLITQTRETHVKQLQMGSMKSSLSMPNVDIYPYFPVEPFPTYYLRTARGYRFLDLYLRAVLGSEVLAQSGRMLEDGSTSAQPLAGELSQRIELMYGLYALSCAHLGMDPAAELMEEETLELDMDAAVARARTWLEGWRQDPDVLSDPRVIVPVAYDPFLKEGVYWAVLGVKVYKVGAEFVEGYEPVVEQAECGIRDVVDHNYYILGEVTKEVRFRGAPPTRDEFRALCDEQGNASSIIAALEAR